jgi:hypothetical protein
MFTKYLTNAAAVTLTVAALVLSSETAKPESSSTDDEYTHVPVNVSFVPNVGTGGFAGGNTESNVSFNVIGGAIGTLKGAELGSIVNIERNDVIGAQMSGIVNVVGDNVTGAQIAGISNITGNVTRGLQVGGISNFTGNNSSVCQIGGVANVAGSSNGLQVAGVANVADNINGAQISGVVNVARSVKGTQIGVINVADEINGVPIGLFSYVKSVGLRYQIFIDEIGLTNFAIRNGGEHVYTLLMFGAQINNEEFVGSYGWGIGGRIPVTERFSATTDLLAQALHTKELWDEKTRFISRFRVGGSWQIKPHFALIGGVSINTYLSKEDEGKTLPGYLPDAKKDGKRWKRVWPGAYIGMEF